MLEKSTNDERARAVDELVSAIDAAEKDKKYLKLLSDADRALKNLVRDIEVHGLIQDSAILASDSTVHITNQIREIENAGLSRADRENTDTEKLQISALRKERASVRFENMHGCIVIVAQRKFMSRIIEHVESVDDVARIIEFDK